MKNRFKNYPFYCTAKNERNEQVSTIINLDKPSSIEAMKQARQIYPVFAGFTERTISAILPTY